MTSELSFETPDVLIAGCGPVGCVVAEHAARKGLSVVILEKRSHIAGNCYDEKHPAGFYIHRYGPHYFRTNNQTVFDYLSRFTTWVPGNYRAQVKSNGKLYPFPINLDTLEAFFGRSFDEKSAREFLKEKSIPLTAPRNSEELLLSKIGRELYEAFFKDYTEKQWGRSATELDPSVAARVPVYFDRNASYTREGHQVLPEFGYTAMFDKMIESARIDVRLNSDFHELRTHFKPKVATIYTGPIDLYFSNQLGRLPWRSLEFKFTTHPVRSVQPVGQINYADRTPATRSVEFGHLTNCFGEETVISTETPAEVGDPYYPIPSPASKTLFEAYSKLAEKETAEKRVFFEGRLARYRYINIDQAVESAIQLSSRIF